MTASELIEQCKREHIGFTECPGCKLQKAETKIAALQKSLDESREIIIQLWQK